MSAVAGISADTSSDVPAGGANRAKMPVAVLTGFLGAGKTTLLRALLASEEAGSTAVLVNEFGEVGIDHLLVGTIASDVVLLDSGCVCCRIRGELKEAVLSLLERRERAELPPFRRMIIETTGLAEPAPIVATLAMDRVLSHQVDIETIVTVVDAVAALDTAAVRPEWLAQVAAADALVVSKSDLVVSGAIDSLNAMLHRLNPAAPIVRSDERGSALRTLFVRGSGDSGRSRSAAGARTRDADPRGSRSQDGRTYAVEPDVHGVRSTVLELDEAVDWTAFGIWFSALLHAHGSRLLRVKGLLDTGGSGPVRFDSVQHSVYPPEHLDAWPDDGRRSRLVFIVDALDPADIHASFRHHVSAAVAAFSGPRCTPSARSAAPTGASALRA